MKNNPPSLWKLTSLYDSFCRYAWEPTDPANLGITRILFGFLMVLDIPVERGFSEADAKWGNPNLCHFPLFDFLRPLLPQYMYLTYAIMLAGALGITLGLCFRVSCVLFLVPYWYLFFLDKTTWNNHSYLYGLLGILFSVSRANHYLSIDELLNPKIRDTPVPRWNYLLLRFQIFLLYFYAGVKKLDADWLGGFSVQKLAHHWVFEPFKFVLSEDAIDYYIVHLGGFFLDLTLGFWLLWEKSRPFALFFGASFHFMNSRIFAIGMFPYACLATMPLFCSYNWPKKLFSSVSLGKVPHKPVSSSQKGKIPERKLPRICLMILYVSVQLYLPWSHNITQGYNNWTNGLYGYSWDMMVHGWQTMHLVVTVKDHKTGTVRYLDTEAFTRSDKWAGHADMVHQYAHCVAEKLKAVNVTDASIYVDVWRSLNGRFQQRMFDPRVDILTAPWSPFQPTPWLLPLLTELSSWREEIFQIEESLHNQSENVSVAFVADFPGLSLENYIPKNILNASLTVLEGSIAITFENGTKLVLGPKDVAFLPALETMLITTTSESSACYMFTYYGKLSEPQKNETGTSPGFWKDFYESSRYSLDLTRQALLNVVFGVPLKKQI